MTRSTSDQPSVRRSRRPRVAALALAAMLLVAGSTWALAARPWERGPRAEPGAILPGEAVHLIQDPTSDGSAPVKVLLPTGGLAVAFGEPVQEIPRELREDLSIPRPPEGGAYLPVHIGVELPEGHTSMRLPGAAFPDPTLVLEAGGVRTDLSSMVSESFHDDGLLVLTQRTAVVAIADAQAVPRLRISFDGQEQVLTPQGTADAGRFAALADIGPSPAEDCTASALPAGWEVDGLPGSICRRTGAAQLPWIGGLGWAPEGTLWQVTGLAIQVPAGAWDEDPEGDRRFLVVQELDQVVPQVSAGDGPALAVFSTDEVRSPLTLASAGAWTVITGPVPPGTEQTLTVTLPLQARTDREGGEGREELDLALEYTTTTH